MAPADAGDVAAVSTPTPQATTTLAPTATPDPTAAPELTATPEPSATPAPTSTPDPTPVVLQGADWAITEADVERLSEFIEDVHELDFRAPVAVGSDDDIGASFANGLEVLEEGDWRLMVALGLIEDDVDRDVINQVRRDRIRGVCCEDDGLRLMVIVEPRATLLETEVILVHELVHALHRQHPDLVGRPGRSGGFELPSPYAAIIESIPQFVAFRYFESQPLEDQQQVREELPVITPDLEELVGRVPGAMLNFAYSTAPALADAAYAERGAAGLLGLLMTPPTTTEQVLFPDRWLNGEDRVSQDPPVFPSAGRFVTEGRLGVVVLEWMLEDLVEPAELRGALSAWTGDRWTLYRLDGGDCVAATIEMDDADSAATIAALLSERLGLELIADDERRIRFDTC